MARGGRRGRSTPSGGGGRARPRGLDRLPPPDRSPPLRRHRHREPVRRHPLRRGGGDQRIARPPRVSLARGARHRARHVRDVRAGARKRAADRRKRPGQPARRGRIGRVDAAPLPGRGGGGGRPRGRDRRGVESGPRTADLGGRAATDEVTDFLLGRIALTQVGRRHERRDRPVRHDPARRHAARGLVLSLADKLKVAQRLDEAGFAYIEGGWPGSNPKDEEFFAAVRGMAFRHARLAAFGSTRHRANQVEDDPNIQALLAAETPTADLRKELAAP